MAMENHLQEMHELMKIEFSRIGIGITAVNVSYRRDRHAGRQLALMSQVDDYPIMDLHFTCTIDQMNYLKIFVSESVPRNIPIPPPVHIYGAGYDITEFRDSHRVDQVYDCMMQISVTGGSVDPFIHSFRHETQKLRYEVESKEFDGEVEKMLTDDGYND